jgi:glutamine cyclotransferase
MKNTFLFCVIVLAFVFSRCTSDHPSGSITGNLTPAKFLTPTNNTAIKKGQELLVELSITDVNNLEHLKVFSRDTMFFDGKPEDAKMSFTLETNRLSLGSKQITLEATLKDGRVRKDNRIIRVLSDIYPKDFKAEVVNVFPHKTSSYTQGLEFYKGQLFEGTGGMGAAGGKSKLMQVDLESGNIQKEIVLEPNYFGEGITILGERIYQLTWQQNKCFVYDVNTFEKLEEFTYSGEGWGLTNDGEHLIMSDGSERIYVRDPKTFGLLKTIEVYSNAGPMQKLNELEYIDGKLYANVYLSNNILKINSETGAVEAVIDASLVALDYKENGEVLNGIAYRKEDKRLFITGKNWPSLLEIELIEL